MKIYIAGPMTGLKDFNFPAFFAAESELSKQGHVCFNPARNDEEKYGINAIGTSGDPAELPSFDLRKALADDTRYICEEADGIYMLTGWEHSSGANAEHALAKALRLKIIYQ